MPDPMDELEHFNPGLTMNPLPASEVRRRGTRMRRRNNALATIGSVAAVAIIATPIALAANGGQTPDGDRSTPVATAPPGGWKQEIPADLDLGALPSGTGFAFDLRDESVVDDATLCGTVAFSTGSAGPAGPAVDVAGATWSETGSDGGNGRTLAVYSDAEAAAEALDGLRDGVLDCPEEPTGNGQTFVNDAVDVSVPGAEDSFVFTNQVRGPDDLLSDMTTVEAVRIGNALFLGNSVGTAGGDQAAGNIDNLLTLSAPVVDQMCTFSIEGCAPTPPDASEAVEESPGLTGEIPETFPLEKGLPTDPQGGVGVEGPSHDLDLAPYNLEGNLSTCDASPVNLPMPVDRLAAGYRSPETGVLRQLHTFASVEDAQAWAEGVLAPFAACVEYPQGGVTQVNEVTPEDAGDYAASAVSRFEVDGEPGPGYEIVQVVRVGQAVLFTLVASEGDLPQAPDALRTMYLENSQSVIDAMN